METINNEEVKKKSILKKLLSFKWELSSMIISFVALITITLLPGVKNIFHKDSDTQIYDVDNWRLQIERLQNELHQKDNQIHSLLIKIDSYNDSIAPTQDNTNYISLCANIEETRQELDKLNKIIIDNPEKALSLPLLKMDIQNLKDDLIKNTSSQKEEIARVYDINKWIIGLVFSMIVSVIILNIGNLIKSKKEK